MPKAKAAPNFNPMLEDTGDALSDEEKAAAAAEESGAVAIAPEDGEQPEGGEQQAAEQPETAEGKSRGRKPSTIPYDRFQEVVEERNQTRLRLEQIERENADSREKWARLQERQQMATEAQNRAAQAAAVAERAAQRPDPDVDAAGARAWDAEQRAIAAEQRVGQLENFVNTRSTELQGWTQQQQMEGYIRQAADRGRAQHADWDARVDFARAERTKMWMSVGHSEDAAKKIVANEETALVVSAAQTGADLVPVIASMTAQWGYKPPTNGATRTNGTNGSVKLEQIANGQRVQGLGRTQSAETPSQKQWQTMDNQEFAVFIANMEDTDFLEFTKDKTFNKRVASLDTGA